jgi:hypothetical protein
MVDMQLMAEHGSTFLGLTMWSVIDDWIVSASSANVNATTNLNIQTSALTQSLITVGGPRPNHPTVTL